MRSIGWQIRLNARPVSKAGRKDPHRSHLLKVAACPLERGLLRPKSPIPAGVPPDPLAAYPRSRRQRHATLPDHAMPANILVKICEILCSLLARRTAPSVHPLMPPPAVFLWQPALPASCVRLSHVEVRQFLLSAHPLQNKERPDKATCYG